MKPPCSPASPLGVPKSPKLMKPPCSPGASQENAPLPPTVTAESAAQKLPAGTASLDGAACDLDLDSFAAINSTSVLRPAGFIASISAAAAADAEGSTATWLKKRRIVETVVGLLPPEREASPCGFVLRLLREACMAEASAAATSELEARAAAMLDRAALQDVMIPAFRHTCGTLLDVGLMLRLVRGFAGGARSGAAMLRASKLVDAYLAEAAVDAALPLEDFEELARALPEHARDTDDGLYRAVDTYIKAHPRSTKKQRMALWGLIHISKLSSEAALHAAHNERLPVRAAIHVLVSEQTRLNRGAFDRASRSFSGLRTPSIDGIGPSRAPSKRDLVASNEMRRLGEDVARLQLQCRAMESQIDRLWSERRKKGGRFLRWSSFFFGPSGGSPDIVEKVESSGDRRSTPRNKWRHSMS